MWVESRLKVTLSPAPQSPKANLMTCDLKSQLCNSANFTAGLLLSLTGTLLHLLQHHNYVGYVSCAVLYETPSFQRSHSLLFGHSNSICRPAGVLTMGFFYSVFRLLFGTLYPAYASYKAVRTKNVKEYVSVFIIFNFLEAFFRIIILK